MNHKHEIKEAGYYEVVIGLRSSAPILRSNNERAFVMSQFQDLLGRRSLLEEPGNRYRLSSHIDLLAFSIFSQNITFITFSIAQSSVQAFAEIIAHRLQSYQSEWSISPSFHSLYSDEPSVKIIQLAGPYEALNHSVLLHLRHNDWEYDRYSSIGFYLHDRRGDWMHLWRLSRLYENDAQLYTALLKQARSALTGAALPTGLPFAPLSHG